LLIPRGRFDCSGESGKITTILFLGSCFLGSGACGRRIPLFFSGGPQLMRLRAHAKTSLFAVGFKAFEFLPCDRANLMIKKRKGAQKRWKMTLALKITYRKPGITIQSEQVLISRLQICN
jgi:hypothetical protein